MTGQSLPQHESAGSYVYTAVTAGIRVSVTPWFLEEKSEPQSSRYFWAYTVEVANETDETVQLRSRYWRITDGFGRHQEVRGPGVVGEEPVIAPGQCFEYTSSCPLGTPTGFMVGAFQMQSAAGSWFTVDIPAFSLHLPEDALAVN